MFCTIRGHAYHFNRRLLVPVLGPVSLVVADLPLYHLLLVVLGIHALTLSVLTLVLCSQLSGKHGNSIKVKSQVHTEYYI